MTVVGRVQFSVLDNLVGPLTNNRRTDGKEPRAMEGQHGSWIKLTIEGPNGLAHWVL